jgi:Lipase (class 3)
MQIEYDATRAALFTPETRDTLFEGGQSYSTLQLAIEAARLAYFRAESSKAEFARLTEALARVGFAPPQFISDSGTDTQAFLSRRPIDGISLLAFRGTQPDSVMDIASDLGFTFDSWTESAGNVHHGFARDARSVLPEIKDWMAREKIDPVRLVITGHSLGAALATLAATVLHPGWLVTLGSPRVGDSDFVRTVVAANNLRIVDCCDVVTQVPPPHGGYTHICPYIYLTRDGKKIENPDDKVVSEDRHVARLEYIERYAWRMKTVAVRDLADHAPVNYARCFFSGTQSADIHNQPLGKALSGARITERK